MGSDDSCVDGSGLWRGQRVAGLCAVIQKDAQGCGSRGQHTHIIKGTLTECPDGFCGESRELEERRRARATGRMSGLPLGWGTAEGAGLVARGGQELVCGHTKFETPSGYPDETVRGYLGT